MMRARIDRCIVGALLLAALPGCSNPVKVQTNLGALNLLHTYHTYAWMSRDPTAIDNAGRIVLDQQVHLDVDGYLALRGFQKTGLESPDFMVGYEWKIGPGAADTIGDYFWYRGAGGTKNLVDAYAVGYEEGVFTLEFIDTSTRRTIWQAQTKALVGRNDQPEKLEDVIAAVFQKLEEDQKD